MTIEYRSKVDILNCYGDISDLREVARRYLQPNVRLELIWEVDESLLEEFASFFLNLAASSEYLWALLK